MAITNLNDFSPDIPTWDMARKTFMALGMASRYNTLYAWHWYSHEDPKTHRRVLHKNLQGFLPYMKWIRDHREFLGDLRLPTSQVAILKPIRSELINFWQNHDSRVVCKSHPGVGPFYMQGYCAMMDMLSESNIPWDTIAEEHLAELLPKNDYRLLIVADQHLTEATVATIRRLPGQGRQGHPYARRRAVRRRWKPPRLFPGPHRPAEHACLSFWELEDRPQLIAFPDQAKVILVESASRWQLPYLTKWAGIAPAMEFIDDLTPKIDWMAPRRTPSPSGRRNWARKARASSPPTPS